MEKTCANHPESLALATCKACEKSVCLMCVLDEKEGTFCSSKCVQVFREVSDWVDPGSAVATAAAPAPAAQPSGSIFDPEPGAAPAAANLPPAPASEPAEFEPLVTPGTKWRMIGSVCASHSDTPAVATCEACDKTVCSLCVVEAENGTFCTTCAAAKTAPAPRPITIAAPKPVPVPAPMRITHRKRSSPAATILIVILIVGALGGGGYYYFFLNGTENTTGPNNPDPIRNPDLTKKTDPVKTDPVKTDPVKTDPVKTDPVKTDPVKTDPTKGDPLVINPRRDPPVRPKLPGMIDNPWANVAPGAWYRMKTEKDGQASYTDIVLQAKDAESYTLGDVKTSIPPYWRKGEESLPIEDQNYLCEVRETETPPGRRWVLIQGRNAGAVLKVESEKVKMTVTRLWDNTVKVGRRSFDCVVIEGTENGVPFKRWFCASLAPGTVRLEMSGATTTMIDLGSDASTRPALPK